VPLPGHVPGVAVSVCPAWAVPAIVGRVLGIGAPIAAILNTAKALRDFHHTVVNVNIAAAQQIGASRSPRADCGAGGNPQQSVVCGDSRPWEVSDMRDGA
jgi:hypothetical protein